MVGPRSKAPCLPPALPPSLPPSPRTVDRRPIIAPPIQNRDGNGGPEKQFGGQAGVAEREELLLEEEVGEPEDTFWRQGERDGGREGKSYIRRREDGRW